MRLGFRRALYGYSPEAVHALLDAVAARQEAEVRAAERRAAAARARVHAQIATVNALRRWAESGGVLPSDEGVAGLDGASPSAGDDGSATAGDLAPGRLPTTLWGYDRQDVDAYLDWLRDRHERRLDGLGTATEAWRSVGDALDELVTPIQAWVRATRGRGGASVATALDAAWEEWTVAPAEDATGAGEVPTGRRGAVAVKEEVPTGPPEAFRSLADRLAASQAEAVGRSPGQPGGAEPGDGDGSAERDGGTVAAHILPPNHNSAQWVASVVGDSPSRLALPAPGLRLLSRDGHPLGRAAALYVRGFPPQPIALELVERDADGVPLAVAATDVAMVQSDRVRLREGAQPRPLTAFAGLSAPDEIALRVDGASYSKQAPSPTPSGARELVPVVIIVGPSDAYANIEAVADAIDAAADLQVDFRLFRDGMYRVDGRVADRLALAALLERLPNVAAVVVDGETVHVTLREGAA